VQVDPAASMRCWGIELELGGRTYEVPALPAADWFPILASGDLSHILDLVMSTPGEGDLDEQLLTGEIEGTDLGDVLRDAVEEIAGRSFHSAVVLAVVAEAQWSSINGRLVLAGFRWDVQPIGAALDAIYAVVVGALDDKGRDKFLALLENEALTTPGRKGKVSQRIVSEFEAMAGPKPTGGLTATGAPSEGRRPKTQPRSRTPHQDDQSTGPRKPRAPRARNAPGASS
jgi:hypothetical protein